MSLVLRIESLCRMIAVEESSFGGIRTRTSDIITVGGKLRILTWNLNAIRYNQLNGGDIVID